MKEVTVKGQVVRIGDILTTKEYPGIEWVITDIYKDAITGQFNFDTKEHKTHTTLGSAFVPESSITGIKRVD